MANKKTFPNRVTLELTNRCNLNCGFCPRHLLDMPLGDMDEKLFFKLVGECSNNLPVTLVMFFRGEPLLCSKLSDYIKYAKDKGLGPIQLASNGMTLDDETSDRLLESGLDFISFSLDTNDTELYLQGRKNGNPETIQNSVLSFISKADMRKKKGESAPEIQISSVDAEVYRSKKGEFVDFWIKHADRVRIYAEHSSDGNLGSIGEKDTNDNTPRIMCKKVVSDIVIYHDGTVAICNHDWNNKLGLGNANTDSIFDIWNGIKYNELRKQHNDNSFEDGHICKTCDHWKAYTNKEGLLGELYLKQTP